MNDTNKSMNVGDFIDMAMYPGDFSSNMAGIHCTGLS